jgi:uncharacterized protein involved in exopolysaccharide biosynthesis
MMAVASIKSPAKAKSAVKSSAISTRDVFNAIFFYRQTGVSIVTTFVVLGIIVAFLIPPTYRAEARLLTLYAGYYDMQLDRTGGRASSFDPTQVVNVEWQILASPELHRAVVRDEMGPSTDNDALDEHLRRFEDRLHIEKVETANVIELSFVDSDPVRAAHTLDQLIAQYFRQRAGVFATGRVDFLVAQRDKVRAQLDKANAQLIAFQRAHDVLNIDAQISSTVTLHALLRQRKFENESAFVQDRSTLDALVKEAARIPETIELYADNTEAAHALDTMQMTLLQLESRRADLASRYLEGAPFLQQIDQQIADVKAAIEQQKPGLVSATRSGHNSYFDTVQDRITRLGSDVAGEAARTDSLEKQSKDSDDRLQNLISVANQLRRMEIDRDLLVDSFKNFSQQVELARIEQNQVDTASSTNVRIIQAPFPPTRRSNPPPLFIAASLIAGLFIAGLATVVLSTLRETFLSPEEVERALGLPVLCAPRGPDKPPSPIRKVAAGPLKTMWKAMSGPFKRSGR